MRWIEFRAGFVAAQLIVKQLFYRLVKSLIAHFAINYTPMALK